MTRRWLSAVRIGGMAALVTTGTLVLGCIFTSTRPGSEPGAGSAAATAASAPQTAVASETSAPSASGDPGAAPPPTGSAVVSTEPPPCTTSPPTLKPPEAKIVLIDAGKEPRRVLRYKPRPGIRKAVTYSLQSSMATQQGGEEHRQQGMGFALTVDGRVAQPDKGKEDQIFYDFRVTKLDVPAVEGMPPEFNEAVRKQLAAWKTAKGTVVIDDRGMTQDVKLESQGNQGSGRMHDIRVALEQTANPLPEEAVGVGAKWEVVTVVDTGLTLRGHTVFELVSLQGDKGTVRFTIDQRSDPEPGPAVCPQPNVVVQPISWVASGAGQRSFHLGQLLAGSYETKLKVRNVSRTYVTGEGQVQVQDANVDVELETKMSVR